MNKQKIPTKKQQKLLKQEKERDKYKQSNLDAKENITTCIHCNKVEYDPLEDNECYGCTTGLNSRKYNGDTIARKQTIHF